MRQDRAKKLPEEATTVISNQELSNLRFDNERMRGEIDRIDTVRAQQTRRITELADRVEFTRGLAVSLLQAKMRSARLEGYVDRVRELDGKPPPSERPGLQALEQALRVADNEDFKRITDAMTTDDIDTILREGPTPPSYGNPSYGGAR